MGFSLILSFQFWNQCRDWVGLLPRSFERCNRVPMSTELFVPSVFDWEVNQELEQSLNLNEAKLLNHLLESSKLNKNHVAHNVFVEGLFSCFMMALVIPHQPEKLDDQSAAFLWNVLWTRRTSRTNYTTAFKIFITHLRESYIRMKKREKERKTKGKGVP